MDYNPYAVKPVERRSAPVWTVFDDHLLHSVHVVHDLMRGRLSERAPVPTTAPLVPGELSLAVGPASRHTWRALGNGSYRRDNTVAFGSPAFVLMSLATSALTNANRKSQARADAQARWVTDGQGILTVTNRRAFLGQAHGYLDLNWSGLTSVDLAGPDVFQCSFHDTHTGGYKTVQLHTPWASLMFALAAHSTFPAHPRLTSGGWLPPDFDERCAAVGAHCPIVR